MPYDKRRKWGSEKMKKLKQVKKIKECTNVKMGGMADKRRGKKKRSIYANEKNKGGEVVA